MEQRIEETLVLIKPDAVERGLVGRIIGRFEDKGLHLAALRMLVLDEDLAARHYAEHQGKPFYARLVKFMTGGPVVALVLQGEQAVAVVRKMMGATNYLEAAPGTIRGDFGLSGMENLVHGSDSGEAARREVELFFEDGEGWGEDWLEEDVTVTPEENDER